MYKFLFVAAAILCNLIISAQGKKRFAINPGEKVVEKIPLTEMYKYPEFTLANVSFKDGLSLQAKLNYNSVYGEMQFIDPRGDTLSIADEKNVRWIAAKNDTFYFYEGWLELVANNNTIKLAKKKMFEISNKEKIGGMDIPAFGAIETNTKSTASQHTRDLIAKEKLTYTEYITYYFADRFNNFFPASKKSLLKIYGRDEKKIEQYLKDNKINFSSEEDLKQLCNFLNDL
jgi:hypothetical protein